MEPIIVENIVMAIVSVTLFLTIGGVLVLRPIAKRVGDLLEVMTRERLDPARSQEMEHVRDLLETVSSRMALLEERQEFTDRLLQSGSTARAPRLPSAPEDGPQG